MFPFVSSKILRCFVSLLRKFFDISLVRNFVSSKFRYSLSEFSIDHATFLRKLFEFSKKDREISFEISLKIRENKGRISTNFALITFAQYCIQKKRQVGVDVPAGGREKGFAEEAAGLDFACRKGYQDKATMGCKYM